MDRPDVLALFLHYLMLSAISVGGVQAIVPDMYRYVVEVHPWITGKQFADAYSIAQAAPGPNMMYVTLIGWRVAGWAGAIATTLALVLPSVTFSLLLARLSERNTHATLGHALRRGLAPIAIGFSIATAWILVRTVNHDWHGYLLTALTVVIVLRTRLNPMWLIAAGALAGMSGLV